MCTVPNTKANQTQSGSALVIALIVLAILAALGYASLEVADLNIFSSANDRDHKRAFFHAESGINLGTTWLGQVLFNEAEFPLAEWANATNPCNDDSAENPYWRMNDLDCASCENASNLKYHDATPPLATYVRAGEEDLSRKHRAGYPPNEYVDAPYVLQSRRYGERNSQADIYTATYYLKRIGYN